jgi:two-component system, NtrC family, sensor kinase
MKKWIFILIFIYSQTLFSESTNSVIILNSNDKVQSIGNQIYFFEDKSRNLSINKILEPEIQNLFQKSNLEIPNFYVTSSKIWVKFTLINKTEEKALLEIANFWAWYIDFYRQDSAGKFTQVSESGLKRPINRREVDNNFFLFELSNSSEPTTYYFSIQSELGIILPLSIGTAKSFYEKSYPYILFYGIFSGFMISMFLYNAFIYLKLREKIYLYYCGYLLSGLFVFNFISGNYGYKWNPITYYPNLIIFSTSLTAIFILIFIINLLKINRNEWFFRISLVFIFLFLLLQFINLFPNQYIWTLDAFQACSLVSSLFILFYSFYYFKKGNPRARYIAFGFSFHLLGVIIFIFGSIGLISVNFFTINSISLGTSVEVLLFSFALSARLQDIQQIKEENRFINAMAITNSYLLNEKNWIDALQKSLHTIGKALSVDRLYFLQSYPGINQNYIIFRQEMKWESEPNTSKEKFYNFEDLKLKDSSEFFKNLQSKNPILINQSKVENEELLSFMIARKSKSSILVPVFIKEELFGLIGFDDIGKEREISKEEISLLENFVNNLTSTIQKKEFEYKLILQKSYTESLLNAIPDLVFVFSRAGEFLEFKSGSEKDLAMSPDIFLGKKLDQVFPVFLSTPMQEKIDSVIKEKNYETLEYQIPINGISKYFEARFSPFGEDKVIALVHNITEKKLAEFELRATQDQILRSEKLAIMGKLVASVAHEINTPLAIIQASSENMNIGLQESLKKLPLVFELLSYEEQLLFFNMISKSLEKINLLTSREERRMRTEIESELEILKVDNKFSIVSRLCDMGLYNDLSIYLPLLQHSDADLIIQVASEISNQQKSVNMIQTAIEKASKVVFALKNYARQDNSLEKTKIRIQDGIDTVLTMYHGQIRHTVDVHRDYNVIPEVMCYPEELNQIWTNLIHNALQSMNFKGTLTIRISAVGNQFEVGVKDSGTGIPLEIQDKIFEPFFTTKPSGEGSGLGLDIVKKIVNKHNGKVWFETKEGEGTEFIVRIPIES